MSRWASSTGSQPQSYTGQLVGRGLREGAGEACTHMRKKGESRKPMEMPREEGRQEEEGKDRGPGDAAPEEDHYQAPMGHGPLDSHRGEGRRGHT